MKKIIGVITTICVLLSFAGCGETACEHDWRNATCENPTTCTLCGETAGDPNGHHWIDATCTAAKTCDICGATEGDALGHTWADATCTKPKTCDICGETEGKALGHAWKAATYSAPKTCSVCGKTEGSKLTKSSSSSSTTSTTSTASTISTASTARTCAVCGTTLSSNQILFCSMHGCSVGGCANPAKRNSTGGYGSCCETHSCHHPNCLSYPIGNTGYCGAHGGLN